MSAPGSHFALPSASALPMLRRPAGASDGEPNPKKFKATMEDLYLSNALSGQQVREVLDAAQGAGVVGVGRLAAAGSGGRHPGNISRDLMSRILKDRRGFWPKPWQLQVPLWSKKHQREVTGTIYMMLPHSIVGHWLQKVPDVLPPLQAGAQSSSLCVLQWHGSCMWARGRSCPLASMAMGSPSIRKGPGPWSCCT